MNVRTLVLKDFMSHTHTTVQLPARGLVVVTGDNGAGKSSLIEAVAMALWGKTLRGTDPWRTGVAGVVSIQADLVHATRATTARGGKKLEWSTPGEQPTTWETQSKAQTALEAHVGDLEVWRRTHVFSSQDAAHFSSATDAERKRLLETMLGLECFDTASDAARADLRATEERIHAFTLELTYARERRAAAGALLLQIDQQASPAPPEPAQPDPVAVAHVASQCEQARQEHSRVRALHQEAAVKQASTGFEVRQFENTVRRLQTEVTTLASGSCPTCGGAVSPAQDHLHRNVETLRDAEASLQEARAEAAQTTQELTALQLQLNTLVATLLTLERWERTTLQEAQDHAHWRHTHAQWKQRADLLVQQRTAAQASLAGHTARQEALDKHLATVHREVALLRVVTMVLGLKGVRAHVLGKALVGIEAVANGWLARIAQRPMAIRLKPYTQGKTGSVSDAISLDVEGVGEGRGYRAASGGERRRIDAALLLALAEVSAAAYGRQPGTVFMDEVFDALDSEGVEAVGEALAELAQDRAVVLLTHSSALASSVRAALRLHVSAGSVQEVSHGK